MRRTYCLRKEKTMEVSEKKFLLSQWNVENRYLNIEEAASYLNVKLSTIYRWVNSKTLPHYKFGRLVRFSKGDLEEWAKRQKIEERCERDQRKIKDVLRPSQRNINIDRIIRRSIEEVKGRGYTTGIQEKPGKDRGLGKEGV